MNCWRFGPLSPVPLDLEGAICFVIFALVYPVCGVRLDDTGEPVAVDHLPLPPRLLLLPELPFSFLSFLLL